jgi:ATP:ADP antiporter, AAA family
VQSIGHDHSSLSKLFRCISIIIKDLGHFSTMPERDPFPMTSTEAKALEASVAATDQDKQWSSMKTKAGVKTPSGGSGAPMGDEYEDATSGLVVKKSSVRKDEEEDIYAHVDKERVDEDDDPLDPILDVPLDELRGDPYRRYVGQTKRSLLKLYYRVYGDKLPPEEMLRTLTLASTLFFMIGGYWSLRSLKDTVLISLCGYQAIPKAKMLSVFVVLGVVSVYNHLLDSSLAKHQLFYVFATFYFGLFTLISILLMDPTIGLANRDQSEDRILGWISYCSIESYGSVMVSLFWSFANSNIKLETAKASYGVMVALAQLGSIMGPAVVQTFANHWGVAQCYLMGSLSMLLLQCTMYYYVRTYGTSELRERANAKAAAESLSAPLLGERANEKGVSESATAAPSKEKKPKAGVLEGLQLFWKYNYVKGIFAISCLFMVEVTIVDFTLKVLATEFFSEEFPCETSMECYNPETKQFGLSDGALNGMASFMGFFGVATNSLSFVFSLLGTSAVIRYLGLRLTLLLFPSLCLIVIILVRLRPTLYVVFFAMIMLKANSYALNNPTKELLYQPTSSAVRYKAKSWIDIFGARGSKALGSVVTNAFSDSAQSIVANGSFVGIAVSSFLIWNARFMGKKFEEYTASGYIVGDDDANNPESKNIQMAIEQNKSDDTSCAIPEDDDDDDENNEGGESKPTKKAEIALV